MHARSNNRRQPLRRATAAGVDVAMCASMNLLQSRHRLNGRSAEEMERYVAECEKLTPHEYYAVRQDVDLVAAIRHGSGASVTWRRPIQTKFPPNNSARGDFFLFAP